MWSRVALAWFVWTLAGCATAPPPVLPPPQTTAITPVGPAWPRREVLDLAMQAFRCGAREGRFPRPVLTVIDYSLPSFEPRLWVIDLRRKRVLRHELVAHGLRSGDTMASAFSNDIGSHQSSLGLFETDETYTGRFGYALRLTGLEPGVNDNARERAIVVHGASYVSRATIAQHGRIGTTLGCPGLPEDVAPHIIEAIAGGSALFAYYPDQAWLQTSPYLHCSGPPADASELLAMDNAMHDSEVAAQAP